jgi:hypothetical protein
MVFSLIRMGSSPKNMVEKYKWWGVISVLFPLIMISLIMFFQGKEVFPDGPNYILNKKLTGVILEKSPAQHGFHTLKIRISNDSIVSVDTEWFNIYFTKFISVRDSIYSESGDTIIKVFRSDSVYYFNKNENRLCQFKASLKDY